jgi:hypothetical protein
MKLIFTALAATGLIMASATAHAGPGKNTPGHMMQRYGSAPGHPGASGYAPGHRKHHRETVGLGWHDRYRYHHRHRHHRRWANTGRFR